MIFGEFITYLGYTVTKPDIAPIPKLYSLFGDPYPGAKFV